MAQVLIDFLSLDDLELARKITVSLSGMFGTRVTFRIKSLPATKVIITGEVHEEDNPSLVNLVWFNTGFYYCAHMNSLL